MCILYCMLVGFRCLCARVILVFCILGSRSSGGPEQKDKIRGIRRFAGKAFGVSCLKFVLMVSLNIGWFVKNCVS